VGATVAVPRDGWGGDESGGGVAAGPRAVAAWRLLDAQWFGVPQRRLRVFVLGARAGGADPAEVLLEPQGVYRDPPTRREAREGSTVGSEDRPSISFVLGSDPISRVGGAAQPVTCRNGDPGCVLAFDALNNTTADTAHTLRSNMDQASGYGGVLAFNTKQDGTDADTVSPSLLAMPHDTSHPNGGGQVGVVCTTGYVTHALTHEGHDAGEDGTGRGTPIICAFKETGHEKWRQERIAGSLNAHEAREAHTIITDRENASEIAPKLNGTQRQQVDGAMTATAGIPRRLMPIECERLMGWDDNWTNVPDEKGKPASDSVRYKAIGNGVVSNVAQWIAGRLIVMHQALVA
jgi:DNA (cytosine-5)-methyltransferase 1